MLQSVKDLGGYTIEALNGRIGEPYEFCFDDQAWELRYAVIEAGDWLLGHKVLISMDRFGSPEPGERKLPVTLTVQQVQDSPSIGTDKPVYLQQKSSVYDCLGWAAEAHMSGTWLISLIDGPHHEIVEVHIDANTQCLDRHSSPPAVSVTARGSEYPRELSSATTS